MKGFARFLLLLWVLLSALCPPELPAERWAGVDETVIEKVAEAAGRPAREPFINTGQGDILLFVFLLAGIAGGFVAGYHFRTLFPPRDKSRGREQKGRPQPPAEVRGISPAAGSDAVAGDAAER